jgi:hypothetical protein
MKTTILLGLALLLAGCRAGSSTPAAGALSPDDPMAAAAAALLDALDPEQRAACTFAFEDAERRNWQPVPFGDAGMRLGDMSEAQRAKVRGLLRSALSEEGVATVDGVIVLERILVGLEQERGHVSRFHGPERYFVTVFGDPRSEAPWAWRMEGHHLSITFTCRNGAWTAHGPIFVGAQPARVRGGEHDGMRILGRKDDNVRALLATLDESQRARAVAADALPGNVILLPGRDDGFAEPRGLPGAAMTPAQRADLARLLSEWAAWLRVDLAEAEVRRMKAGLAETHLLWIGGTGVDEPHYWRITGPHFALEYAAPERDPDHVHALWRDFEKDFGRDPLRRHLHEDH